ncbi:biotin--[acetyl-CoA-carboxylase] ligase [soil metagenome]
MNINILRYETIDSTNSEAAKQAKLGADEGVCVIAKQQTAGRGRNGRDWISHANSGLYFSIVLRPKIDARYLPLITLMAGVAVWDTLKELGVKPVIKWVNDVLVDNKKICGILAETVDTSSGLAVIVGIGVNLTSANFPDEIADTATSIKAETGKTVLADELAERLTPFLFYFYDILNSADGPREIIERWRQRSSYFSGKPVRVTLNDGSIDGITDGLEENGALRVKLVDGSVRIIQAGDVERLRQNDR